jgi:hypothetical protein
MGPVGPSPPLLVTRVATPHTAASDRTMPLASKPARAAPYFRSGLSHICCTSDKVSADSRRVSVRAVNVGESRFGGSILRRSPAARQRVATQLRRRGCRLGSVQGEKPHKSFRHRRGYHVGGLSAGSILMGCRARTTAPRKAASLDGLHILHRSWPNAGTSNCIRLPGRRQPIPPFSPSARPPQCAFLPRRRSVAVAAEKTRRGRSRLAGI